ncbi:MAG: hypothetical protein M3220_21290 [Chloroflexota bacterium]|nr:hypothetical protein [Chloroflexota bacterium]
MAEFTTCPTCGATDQEVGKYCEQCGGLIEATTVDAVPDTADVDTPSSATPTAADATPGAAGLARFVRVENGVLKEDQAFAVPVGAQLLVGRTDPATGVFPEVDVTAWSERVPTSDGPLYTIHRKQCYISRDQEGRVWIRDYPDYVGDTMVAPAGTSQFQTIPALHETRVPDDQGAIALEAGDRVLMGQGAGLLIFELVEE